MSYRTFGNRVFPQSLVLRVYALTSSSLVLFAIVGLVVFYNLEFSSHVHEAKDTTEVISDMLEQVIVESQEDQDYPLILHALEKAGADSHVDSITFRHVNGKVLKASNPSKAQGYAPQWLKNKVKSDLADMSKQIAINGKPIGTLTLRYSIDVVANEIWHLIQAALWLAFSSLLGGIFIVWWPLKKWLSALDRFSGVDNTTAPALADASALERVPSEFRPMFKTLSETSASLQTELKRREAAMASLRSLVESLFPESQAKTLSEHALEDNLEVISRRIVELVKQRESDRQALKNQKFALDQHAIVSMCDMHGNLIYANNRFCESLGYERDELLGKGYQRFRTGFHDAAFYKDIWETVLRGRVWQGEICNLSKNGEALWFSSTMVPLVAQVSEEACFISICTDITLMKQTKAELERAKELAESANRSKSGFLANMSHEIRTPMNGILGMTDLALETELTQTQRDYLLTVKHSADALMTIINDILDLSKIEAGKVELELIDFDFHALLSDVIKLIRPRADQKGLICRVEIDPVVPRWVKADPVRIRQVLLNLVGNAVKFTATGEVLVRAESAESPIAAPQGKFIARIAVVDTGIGIAREHLLQIFEPFTQEDISTTRKFGGTGLGLSISKKLVELMGGRIWANSERGKGSAFQFELPLPQVAQPKLVDRIEPSLATEQAEGARPVRVLLVEDNVVNQKLAKVLLEREGCQVTTVSDGVQALKVYKPNLFDIVFMDMQMPVMDGLEATRSIRKIERMYNYPRVRIAAMTANAMESDKRACLDAGMDDFLSKPIKVTEIKGALERWAVTEENA